MVRMTKLEYLEMLMIKFYNKGENNGNKDIIKKQKETLCIDNFF